MPGVTWNDETDRKLFLYLLKNSTERFDYDGAAAEITTPEVTCTTTAVISRIKKLRSLARKADEGTKRFTSPADEEGALSPAAPKTPKTPKTPMKGKGVMKGTKRGRPARSFGEDDDEDDEAKPTPAKKGRKAVTPKAKVGTKAQKSVETVQEEGEDEDVEVKDEAKEQGDEIEKIQEDDEDDEVQEKPKHD